MKYAEKINFLPDLKYISKASVVVSEHGKRLRDDSVALTRKYIPKKQSDMIRDSLPEGLQKHFLGTNLSEISLLGPHSHLIERSVINIYLQTNGEVTKFWEGEIEVYGKWSHDDGNGYINCNPDKLTFVEVFSANTGESWLLDSRQPHSVELGTDDRVGEEIFFPIDNSCRKMVQIYLSAPFLEAKEYFDGTKKTN